MATFLCLGPSPIEAARMLLPGLSGNATNGPTLVSLANSQLDIFSQLTNGLSMCSAKIDVVFVLDGSGSISEADWPLVLGFVKQVSDHFVMSSSAANIGVVQFSAAAAKECELTDDAAAFGTCATSIQQMRYTTRSDLGLQKAREMLESSPRSASVQGRLVFFVGDGDADMAANEEARRLETMGQTQIFSIAVGPGANEHNLKALATQEKDFFRVGQFDRLLTILGRILMASCDYDQGQAYGNNRLSTVFHTFDTLLRQWEVLDTLAKRLQYEDQSRILKGFMKLAQPVIARLSTGSTKKMVTMLLGMADEGIFAQSLSQFLSIAATTVNVEDALQTKMEVQDFFELNLLRFARQGGEKFETLRQSLAGEMERFMGRAAAMSKISPIFGAVDDLWTAWQETWGPIRIFVRMSTQCAVADEYGARLDSTHLKSAHQQKWAQCSKVTSFPKEDFPSAVMGCARPDGSTTRTRGDNDVVLDRDRMVRYLGCGKNRLPSTLADDEDPAHGGGGNPPIGNSSDLRIAEGCAQGTKAATDWLTDICPAGSGLAAGVSSGCRVYGPFWSVYGAKLEHLYGLKPNNPTTGTRYPGSKRCHQTDGSSIDNMKCGDAQVEAFKGMVNEAPAEYVYGSLPPLPNSKARSLATEGGLEPMNWARQQHWALERYRRLDPPMVEVLRDVEKGNSVVMVAYGFSGSGKTTTLIGDSTAPVGGLNGIDGVLTLYLKDRKTKIRNVQATFFELYGRMDPKDGSLMSSSGLGLWGYSVEPGPRGPIVSTRYLGAADRYLAEKNELDFGELEKTFGSLALDLVTIMSADGEGEYDWGQGLKQVLTQIENARSEARTFAEGGDPLGHIRATPNNPKSSRGTLFTLLDIEFDSGEHGHVSVVDLAGAEDPVVMVEGYLEFFQNDADPVCSPGGGWRDAPLQLSSKRKMIRKYLHNMDNMSMIDGELQDCFKLRKWLVPCGKDGGRDCQWLTNTQGQRVHMRPDLLAPKEYIVKNMIEAEPFVFSVEAKSGNNYTFYWTQEEVLHAMDKGEIRLASRAKRTKSATSLTPWCSGDRWCTWADRLWSQTQRACKGAHEEGCRLDDVVLGSKVQSYNHEDAGYKRKAFNGKTWAQVRKSAQPLLGYPARLPGNKGVSRNGKVVFKFTGPYATSWGQERTRFWNELADWMGRYEARVAAKREDWTLHAQYFTKSVGPMIQEAFFINEVLNEMRGYLSTWAYFADKKEKDEPLKLWPPRGSFFGDVQVVNSADPHFIESGYDKDKCVQSSTWSSSYVAKLSQGEDRILAVGLLEYLRQPAQRQTPPRDTKVLFGAFVRTDIPGADGDCSGALQSLEFAQTLQDAIPGQRRSRSLPHLRHF
jgi:hypothetical protein